MSWEGLKPGERPFREVASLYAQYRYRPSEAFVRLLATHLGWSEEDRVLDLGAGPAHVSLLYAPFVGEVVVMDPEPDMIEEGRRRAAATGVDNVSFVVGGSDDLSPELGAFAAVTISHAFHWMADQAAVLRALEELLDRERGAVALVGYLKDPGADAAWFDRPPWNAVAAMRRDYLADVPEGPNPRGRHDPFPDLLARSAFSRVELLTYEHERTIQPSVDAAIRFQYTLSNVLARLGDRRAAFEADVRTALADADTSPFAVRVADSALVGRRP
jgi:SAM-dependent methyltransferase